MSPQPYLLDTTALIDVSRRRQPASWWLQEMLRGPDLLAVSAINVAEFFAGLRPEQRREWEQFVGELTHWDVTRQIAILGGTLRHDLAQRGRALLISDALIAATALAHDAVLVTANIRDFTEAGVATLRLR